MNLFMTPDLLLGAFLMSKGIESDSIKHYDNLTYFVFDFDHESQKAFEEYQTDQMLQEIKKNYDELEKINPRYKVIVEKKKVLRDGFIVDEDEYYDEY